MPSNVNADYKEKYSRISATVERIGEKAVWLSVKQDGVERNVPVGKAAFEASSLERLENYRGALPMEFKLSVPTWLTSQWARQGIKLK